MITGSWDASGLPALRLREGGAGLVSSHEVTGQKRMSVGCRRRENTNSTTIIP
jgi:hypothetical protein